MPGRALRHLGQVSAPEIEPACGPWLERIRDSGRLIALAGSLDVASVHRLAALKPDIIAVRGAACRGGDRLAAIDPTRVARLAEAVRSLGCDRHAENGMPDCS